MMKYTSHKKIIPYQTVINFQKNLESLDAIQAYLSPLEEFFSRKDRPNNQQLLTDYAINQLIFIDFYQDYLAVLARLHKDFKTLKESEAIKPVRIS